MKTLIRQIIEGLELLEKNLGNNLHITEAGGCICVWDYDREEAFQPNIQMTEHVVDQLRSLGWHYSNFDGWTHPMSN